VPKPDPVERFIALIRDIDPVYLTDLFMNGGCFHLFLIVREKFPDAKAWWTPCPGHVYIKHGRYWYDIRGRRRKPRDPVLIEYGEHGEPGQWLAERLRCQYHGKATWTHMECNHVLPQLTTAR
jgi:hypothetical protein